MKKSYFRITALIFAGLFSLCAGANEPSSIFKFTGNKDYKSPNHVEISEAENQSENLEENWWKASSFYHIWIKGFADSDDDGCGDIRGIINSLDYIQNNTGCDSIWLSPVFECMGKSKEVSTNMHGYDTVDYYKVNDYFGTEEDLLELINLCHERGMKIIFDFVPNHTSPACQWFIDSYNNVNGKENWYMWSKKPVSFSANGNTTNWYFCDGNNMNYYGAFGPGMPDLNFRNYEVREELKNVVRYWLNKGFDGVRIDAVRYLIETPEERMDTREAHKWFRELRQEVLDKYESPKFMVCEAWVEGNRPVLEEYFGTEKDPEFNMVFDFDQGRPTYSSVQFKRDKTEETLRGNPGKNTCYGTFLGNHDEYESRLGSRMKNDPKKMKLATALSLLRPTVPFIYYGNEIGQKNIGFGGDMRLRGPFQWQQAQDEIEQKDSVLNLNKTLLSLRAQYKEEFTDGKIVKLKAVDNDRCLAYLIKGSEHTLLCVYNFSEDAVEKVAFNGARGVRSGSLLIGDSEAPALEFNRGSAVVKNLAPVSYRVYLLGENAECILDDETYIPGEHYTPVEDTEPLMILSNQMYLRGTMNKWGGFEMMKVEGEEDQIWRIVLELEQRQYEFKFCNTDTSLWGANWGNSSGGNIKLNSEGGRYEIIFNESQRSYIINKL